MDGQAIRQYLAQTDLVDHAAEIHGIACGCVSSGVSLSNEQWLNELRVWFNDDQLDSQLGSIMENLSIAVGTTLMDPDMSMQLLLPGVDSDIRERKDQLAAWCRGFLHGFSVARDFRQHDLSEDVLELLTDFLQISQMSDQPDEDDQELDLLQIEEYVKVGSILIFTVCAEGDSDQTTNNES